MTTHTVTPAECAAAGIDPAHITGPAMHSDRAIDSGYPWLVSYRGKYYDGATVADALANAKRLWPSVQYDFTGQRRA